ASADRTPVPPAAEEPRLAPHGGWPDRRSGAEAKRERGGAWVSPRPELRRAALLFRPTIPTFQVRRTRRYPGPLRRRREPSGARRGEPGLSRQAGGAGDFGEGGDAAGAAEVAAVEGGGGVGEGEAAIERPALQRAVDEGAAEDLAGPRRVVD